MHDNYACDVGGQNQVLGGRQAHIEPMLAKWDSLDGTAEPRQQHGETAGGVVYRCGYA